jgi:hypothetical protein
MSPPARKLDPPSVPMELQKLESELLSLPFVVRRHLAYTLLDSVYEEEDEHEAHRRAMEMVRGEVDGVDADEVIAGLRRRRNANVDVDAALVKEAHRRWEAYQRGEVEGVDADEVIAGLRARLDGDVEAAWAEEAHRRWKAFQRGEEEMLDFDEVMAEIRASFRQ